jgi:hypothetical protein
MAKPVTEQDFLTIILDMMEKRPITAGQAVYMLGHKYGIKIAISEEELISLHEMDLLNSKSYDELVDVKASLNARQEKNLPLFEQWWKDYPSRGVGKSKGVKSTAKSRFLGLSDSQIKDLLRATKLIKTKYIPDQPYFYQLAQVFISNGYEGIIDAENESSDTGENRNVDDGSGSFSV